MRAMAFAQPGGPEVLQLMDLPVPQIEDNEVLVRTQQHTVIGAYMGCRHDLLQCLRLVEKRVFRPVVDSVFPLEKLREAQEHMERREMFGKIVVTP